MQRIVLLSLLLVGLVACQNQEKPMNNQVTGYDHNGLPNATEDSVEFRTNPNPQQAYKVEISLNDIPGKLQLHGFVAFYQAQNCTYTTNRYAGATNSPEKEIEISPHYLSDNSLEGTVYLDAMLDEDYYGQGVCDWQLTSVAAQFRASEDPNDTGFIISGFKNELFPSSSTTLYYLKEDYPKTYVNGRLLEGNSDFGLKKENENMQYGSKWFSITMTIEEVK
ncbi:hypothetical protein GKC56_00075 [Neisseriaceae bacterium PsAf]|nr:hypothetical protein [Neisseriaceae bacterium PsAf]